eukprot:1867113-Amphidinium_carterae.1
MSGLNSKLHSEIKSFRVLRKLLPQTQENKFRENNSDHQYHSKQEKNNKFQEHWHTPKYWKNAQNVIRLTASAGGIDAGFRK